MTASEIHLLSVVEVLFAFMVNENTSVKSVLAHRYVHMVDKKYFCKDCGGAG